MSIAQANAIAATSQRVNGHATQLEELTKRINTLEEMVRALSDVIRQLGDNQAMTSQPRGSKRG